MRLHTPVIEGVGYVVSILSVALLGRVAWVGAEGQTSLQALITLGVILSIVGMALRWSVWLRRHDKHRHKGHKH